MMNKIGQFQVLDSFKVTGRGRIAACKLIEGKVKIGCYAHLQIENKTYLCCVKGMDLGNVNDKNEFIIGLLFFNEEINIEDHKIGEQVIDIFETVSK